MKIDRLLGIVMILLQKDKVTAPYLAERFEVSRRTINRDIEDLCLAGIPIITTQGGQGGISIADGYKVDKSVLTYDEMQNVVMGLKVLDSISSKTQTDQLLNKFFVKPNNILSIRDSIIINLSSHYKGGLNDKISLIKSAVMKNTRITFRYYSSKGDSIRRIEPYYLTFQWSAWYVFGYCLDKEDFRLFKLNRLWELKDTSEVFIPREIPEDSKDFDKYFTNHIQVTLLFDESVRYRLIDDHGVDCYTVNAEGKLLFRMSFTNKDFMISWILGFGDKVEVLYPKTLKLEIKEIAENILKHYTRT